MLHVSEGSRHHGKERVRRLWSVALCRIALRCSADEREERYVAESKEWFAMEEYNAKPRGNAFSPGTWITTRSDGVFFFSEMCTMCESSLFPVSARRVTTRSSPSHSSLPRSS